MPLTKTIFFLSSAPIIGGAERCLQEIVLELRRHGHHCVLVAPEASPLRLWASEVGVQTEALTIQPIPKRAPFRALADVLRYRRFARYLVGKYGEGIFYSNTRHDFIVLALLSARYRKVAHQHGVLSRGINRFLYPRIDTNIFVSQFNYENSDHPANGRVILNAGAIDCDLPPVVPDLPTEPLRLAMFARITRYKGHALVLGASRRMREAGIRHTIDIWGEPDRGPQGAQFMSPLKDQVAREALPVTFKGFHAEPSKGMRDYHCILHPSLNEAFGLVPVEGFSLGVPVISHASGGSLEIYSGLDGYGDFLFRDHTADALAERLVWLNKTRRIPEVLETTLTGIMRDVQTRFSIQRLVDELQEVFV